MIQAKIENSATTADFQLTSFNYENALEPTPVFISSSKYVYFWQKHVKKPDILAPIGALIVTIRAPIQIQISIAWCQNDAEIRGFPTMYTMGGR